MTGFVYVPLVTEYTIIVKKIFIRKYVNFKYLIKSVLFVKKNLILQVDIQKRVLKNVDTFHVN